MTTFAVAEQQADVLGALRSLSGRATIGDVVTATGLAAEDAKASLKALLESHHGHLAVSDSGELLYHFDPGLIRRGTEPLLARLKRTSWDALTKVFKVGIAVMLVVYFAIMVALVLAALFANERGGGNRRSGGWGGGRGRHGGGFGMPNFWLWYWLWSPRWSLGRPYYGQRWERTLPKEDKPPFYKRVFAFVFGPDRPRPTQQQQDRSTLQLIRARNGVLTTAELVEHNALPQHEAEDEMGRLVGAYDGEPVVSPEGRLAYAFPSLMMSAHGGVRTREPRPAWMRLEVPRPLTGNDVATNAGVIAMNGFTLVASATAPWFIFPRLGIGGVAAYVGLVLVPVVYSLLFFAFPAFRALSVRRENRARRRRNVRRVLLGLVFDEAVSRGGGVTLERAKAHVDATLEGGAGLAEVKRVLEQIASEFDADVSPDAEGNLVFSFPTIGADFAASEKVRRSLKLESSRPGDIVFDTGDTASEADARDRKLFDREIQAGELKGYVPAPNRVDYEEDFEVVAFEEELRGRGIALA
ncbi:MAG TPA: hypothetical protein VLA36_07915 [Longimicrobiales bacterium]|nr:hypothetical protein [Longimicrobiales bacterium]